jgi:hypothetical protein
LCALAGYANNDGECWPSQTALSKKTKQTDRSIRNQVQALVESGHIERAAVQGRSGYRLLIDRKEVPVDRNDVPADRNDIPEQDNQKPEPNSSIPEPASGAPEYGSGPSEPPIKPVNEAREVPPKPPEGEAVILPGWLPAEAWGRFCSHRGKKFKPDAQRLTILELDELRRLGHDPTKVLNQSIMNGWSGIFPIKGTGANHAKPKSHSSNPHANLLAGFGFTDLEMP